MLFHLLHSGSSLRWKQLDMLSKWETKYGAVFLLNLTWLRVWTSHVCTCFIPFLLHYSETTFGSVFCIPNCPEDRRFKILWYQWQWSLFVCGWPWPQSNLMTWTMAAWWIFQTLWTTKRPDWCRWACTVFQWLDARRSQRWILCQWLCTGWGRADCHRLSPDSFASWVVTLSSGKDDRKLQCKIQNAVQRAVKLRLEWICSFEMSWKFLLTRSLSLWNFRVLDDFGLDRIWTCETEYDQFWFQLSCGLQ